jgi:hypothetical protein
MIMVHKFYAEKSEVPNFATIQFSHRHYMLVKTRETMSWTGGVQFLAGARHFSVLHSIQTGSKAHPASYPKGIGALSPGVQQPGHEADH